MPAKTHVMHGRDHACGGADPISGICDLFPAGGSTTADKILALAPAAFWKLNETSGSVGHDSADSYDISSGTPPTWAQPAGPPGDVTADFTGDKYLELVSFPAFGHGPMDFTVTGWVYYTDPDPSDLYTIIGQGANSYSTIGGGGWSIGVTGGLMANPHTLLLSVNNGSGSPTGLDAIYSTTVLALNTWYSFAVVYESGTWHMYVDGVLQAGTSTRTIPAGFTGVYVGGDPTTVGGPHLEGRASYIAVFPSALSGAEVASIADTTFAGTPADQVLSSTGDGGTEWAYPTVGVDGARYDEILAGTNLTATDNGDGTVTLDASGGGGAPSGPAGGALDGTYPNPGLAATVAGAGLTETSDVLSVNVDGSTLEIASDALRVKADGITASQIAANAVGSSELAATAVTPGSYGDATHVGQFTVDADGRLTAAANVAVSGGGGAVASDTIWDAKGDLAAATGADAAVKVPVGSNGQILTADSTQTAGIKWAAVPGGGYVAVDTIWDAKGDLAVGTGADTAAKLAVGSNGQVLTADSTQTTGIKWAAAAGGSSAITKLFDSTLGADTLTIDTGAGGIAGGYAVLEIYLYGRSDEAAAFSEVYFQFNNDTAANYDWQRVASSGATTTSSVANADSGWDAIIAGGTAPANSFGMVHLRIPNYDGTVGFKAGNWAEGYASTGTSRTGTKTGSWRNTAAITRVAVHAAFSGTVKLKTGSRLVIFGLG